MRVSSLTPAPVAVWNYAPAMAVASTARMAASRARRSRSPKRAASRPTAAEVRVRWPCNGRGGQRTERPGKAPLPCQRSRSSVAFSFPIRFELNPLAPCRNRDRCTTHDRATSMNADAHRPGARVQSLSPARPSAICRPTAPEFRRFCTRASGSNQHSAGRPTGARPEGQLA